MKSEKLERHIKEALNSMRNTDREINGERNHAQGMFAGFLHAGVIDGDRFNALCKELYKIWTERNQ